MRPAPGRVDDSVEADELGDDELAHGSSWL
jgi:hypothetical protein